MKRIIKNIFYLLSLLAVISIGIVSCDDENNTGYSTMTPTSPTITISAGFTSPVTLTEDNSVHTFTVTLSEPQIADIKLYIKQTDGTASASDYIVTGSLVIPAGSTSASGKIQILSDDMKEETETLTIQIGDESTANAALTPITVSFNINNLTSGDLMIDLTWETDALTAVGLDLTPEKAVDLRFLLINSVGEIVDVADGASFETLTLSGTDLPDGEYRIATDIYSTINAGDFNAPITLDLNLDFNQVGVINDTILTFPAAMTNSFTCSTYRVIMATIQKTGQTYSINKALSLSWSADLESLAGSWSGLDSYDYPSHTVTSISNGKLQITGLAFEWMSDYWGEEVLEMLPVDIVMDWNSHGEFNISEQPYMTTLYKGTEYPYTIKGHGSFRTCGSQPEMTVEYELIQDGWEVGAYLVSQGEPAFSEEITLDVNGIKSASVLKSAKMSKKRLINKPKR
ncbi:MAG TPA: hypothetical protein VFC65_07310 [Prolixibacteraceae bacterium]|nr:hypothetical protein [Prolixibacteraceae bacterium]